jgi:hypothetical protein
MNISNCVFPFGQTVGVVRQVDRTPKRVFVLGVYASAVHARWVGPEPDEREMVKALAVASESNIFWTGDETASVLAKIIVPAGAGRLEPAAAALNGPSGRTLDTHILGPLGLDRNDAWLCDLVPHSCRNDAQQKAIHKKYLGLVEELGLPVPSVPSVPEALADEARREEILDELKESRAKVLILLGDQPIRWFLRHFDDRWKRLSDFGLYGRMHGVHVKGMKLNVLPLAHPRQIAKLGKSSTAWFRAHQKWMSDTASTVGSTIDRA